MRRILVMASALLLSLPFVAAQEHKVVLTGDTSKVAPITVYGFIRNYLNYDSRKTYTVVGGEYNMIPYDEAWNEDHSEDLNDIAHLQLQALTSRFGLNINGPLLGGWSTGGKLEGDYGGFGTNNMVLRLRLAYVKFVKAQQPVRQEFLIGQDWHPLSGDIMPEVLGMAAGAPFRPHSRTPQLRAVINYGHWGCTAALLWQLQYMNNGPRSATDPTSTASRDYADHALFPEVFLGVHYNSASLYAQLGLDYQLLHPRTSALVNGITHRVDETVVSVTPTLYAQYVEGPWSIKFRTLLAQNTSHLNQLVGYAVSDVAADGTWQYVPLRASISYLNVAYGKKLRANCFLGYMKNLGAETELYNFGSPAVPQYYIYMKGGEAFTHLNSAYRIAPSISFNVNRLSVGIEYEWTAVTYGDLRSDGSVANNDNLHQVANHRLCTMLKYSF